MCPKIQCNEYCRKFFRKGLCLAETEVADTACHCGSVCSKVRSVYANVSATSPELRHCSYRVHCYIEFFPKKKELHAAVPNIYSELFKVDR